MILNFIYMAGPFIFPLILLALVIAILAVVNALRLSGAEAARVEGLRGSVDSILFWGGFAAVLGLLGQFSGLYRAGRALADKGMAATCAEAPERCYAMGFAESLTTTMFGFTVLLVAGLLWFVLRGRIRRLAAA